jgi:hypothetical protein
MLMRLIYIISLLFLVGCSTTTTPYKRGVAIMKTQENNGVPITAKIKDILYNKGNYEPNKLYILDKINLRKANRSTPSGTMPHDYLLLKGRYTLVCGNLKKWNDNFWLTREIETDKFIFMLYRNYSLMEYSIVRRDSKEATLCRENGHTRKEKWYDMYFQGEND